MNLSLFEVLSEKSLYKRRKPRQDFISRMAQEEEAQELDREDVLKLNRIQVRYTQAQIEEFVEEHMEQGVMDTARLRIVSAEEFEKLILAYDYSTRKKSRYLVIEENGMLEDGEYRYPALKFVRKQNYD